MYVCLFVSARLVNSSLCASAPVISISLLHIPQRTHTNTAWVRCCGTVEYDYNAHYQLVCVCCVRALSVKIVIDQLLFPQLSCILCVFKQSRVDLAGAHKKI